MDYEKVKSEFKVWFNFKKFDFGFYFIIPIFEIVFNPMSHNNFIGVWVKFLKYSLSLDIYLKVSEKTTYKRLEKSWKETMKRMMNK